MRFSALTVLAALSSSNSVAAFGVPRQAVSFTRGTALNADPYDFSVGEVSEPKVKPEKKSKKKVQKEPEPEPEPVPVPEPTPAPVEPVVKSKPTRKSKKAKVEEPVAPPAPEPVPEPVVAEEPKKKARKVKEPKKRNQLLYQLQHLLRKRFSLRRKRLKKQIRLHLAAQALYQQELHSEQPHLPLYHLSDLLHCVALFRIQRNVVKRLPKRSQNSKLQKLLKRQRRILKLMAEH